MLGALAAARWLRHAKPPRPFICPNPFKPGIHARTKDNLAARLAASKDPTARVRLAFATVLGRAPDRDELRTATAYLAARPPAAPVIRKPPDARAWRFVTRSA